MVETKIPEIKVVKVGGWVKVRGFDLSPGKIRLIMPPYFKADFITEDGGISHWNEPIFLSDIEEIIKNPKEISELEKECGERAEP
ncbi:MAG: hypothetical protein QMD86_02115 [Patescibacteria group bacterium]|nr:hypothetical protein [Patescibacteria group bacterium]